MKALYRVMFDSMSDDDSYFIIHCHTDPIFFQPSHSGLYFHDMCGSTAVSLMQYEVETVTDNAKVFTPCQLRSAHGACRLQCMTGHPSNADLSALVRCNMLKKCPIATPTLP